MAVEGRAHSIRLKAGSNDVLAKVSPNYLADPVFAMLRDVPVCGQ